jgi:uncharacterized protein YbjT (DUF2867 family)
MKQTAIVIGATGLVGRALTDLLLTDAKFDRVKIFARRDTGHKSPKLEMHVVDFNQPEAWQHEVKGDVLFSALGTTLKQAGSKQAQYLVDYTYQYNVARLAAAQGVTKYVLVSAGGSSTKSPIFYSRMKAELERDVSVLTFQSIHILRPGMLAGHRAEPRLGERISTVVFRALGAIPGLGALNPIQGFEVARAMIALAHDGSAGVHIHEMGDLFRLAKN